MIAPRMTRLRAIRLSPFVIWIVHIREFHFLISVQATTNNHQVRSFSCDNEFNPIIEGTGPNFRNILPASNQNESIATLPDREYNILSYYAQTALPINSSGDDFIDRRNSGEQLVPPNPFFDSRLDVARITRKYISRIILGCYNNTEMDQIFLDPATRPFALDGSSSFGDICIRDGDYDFATIDIVQLLYVAKQYPNSMPLKVYHNIRDTLLSISGPINVDQSYALQCQVDFLGRWFRPKVTLRIVDTENHILQIQISRYLSNQLLLEANPNNQEYNNTANGNTVWLLQYISTLVQAYFYEYNSCPYQLYTVKALSALHSYAQDATIELAAEILLDVLTSYSAIQMNSLRRFVPFRRQPTYLNETMSWKGDNEYYRIAVLVGNYNTFRSPEYTIPGHPSLGSLTYVATIASKYRVNEIIYPLFFRGSNNNETDGEYFVSNQNVVEMYYSQRRVLISAGGHESKADVVQVFLKRRFCLFPSCLWDGKLLGKVTGTIYKNVEQNERGWSRPTTIIPSNEPSDDLLNMIRFQGHRSPDLGSITRNLCVGPNFACGMQLLYGNVVEPVLDTCSIVIDDWRFIDFTTADCLNYGYFMAVYTKSCESTEIDECMDVADNYGLLEISEPIVTFEMFQQLVLLNNPKPFVSKGLHSYVPISGAKAIQFEIHPRYEYESQILVVENIIDDDVDGNTGSNNITLILDRNYRNYPKAWSSKGSFQSISAIGRWTFDNSHNGKRYICDVTDPLRPIRITTKLPLMYKSPISYTQQLQQQLLSFHGRYFDDSTSVLHNDSVQNIQFYWNRFGVTGFRIKWRNSGLQSMHGSMPSPTTSSSFNIARLLSFGRKELEYEFEVDEYLVFVGIGTQVWFGRQRVHRIRMVTNKDRTMLFGYGRTEDVVYNTTTINNDNDHNNHIIAFYGRASDDMVHQLGVTTIMVIE